MYVPVHAYIYIACACVKSCASLVGHVELNSADFSA